MKNKPGILSEIKNKHGYFMRSIKKNKDFKNLTEAEIIARLENENYEGGNIGLPENPTLEEKTKYKLCKAILSYQLKNKLPFEKLAEKLAISEEELYDICRGKINDFSVARLIFYLEKLIPSYELLIVNRGEGEKEWTEQRLK
ncbi:MAG: hypothetical protein MRERV_14c028 [Mycoplasmataceae bacterium RV_VA103A]|nr:MAG: hypothetical protein MRERV_14c028 [Mycoplasmataceae bacterium RV_VA103A]